MLALKLIGTSDYVQQGTYDFPQDAAVAKSKFCWVRSELAGTCILGRYKSTVDGNGNANGTTGNSLGEIYLGGGESILLEKESDEIWQVDSYESNTGTNRIYFAPVAYKG